MKNRDKNLKKFYRFNILFFAINIAILVVCLMTTETKLIDRNTKISSNEFLKKELNLDQVQFESINELDKINFEHYQRVLQILCKNREKLFVEVLKSQPDKDEIKKITMHIGHLHTALKRQTVNHLFNIKKVCNDDQQEKLRILFEEVLEVNKYCE